MFVLTPGVGMEQQRHSAAGFVVMPVTYVLGFDMEPEQLSQATGQEPGGERNRCGTTYPWTHRSGILVQSWPGRQRGLLRLLRTPPTRGPPTRLDA